jgi:hypothetical protein
LIEHLPMDVTSFTAGAFAGWIVSEVGKQAISYIFKRSGEKSSEKKKMIRSELGELETKCLEVTSLSVEYYGLPTDNEDAKRISRVLKRLYQEVGVKLYAINTQIIDQAIGRIDFRLWSELKRVTGDQLDVRRVVKLTDDDPRFDQISRASMRLHLMLHQLKHKCI